MGANAVLRARMGELGLTQDELAGQMNAALEPLTGRPGGFSARTVRNLLNGTTTRPIGRTCVALERVFGCPIAELGFAPPSTARPREDPVLRRTFITSVALTAAAPAVGSPRRIGSSDIERLQRRFADIIASDHRHGGQRGTEQKAAAMADEALALQESGTASQRIRSQVYASAAAFRSSAMWAAIDGRRFDDATGHMRIAQELAEMAGDPFIKFRIWSHAGTMYRHMGRQAEAAAANNVARGLSLTRRDPMFASLGLARHAAIYGAAGDAVATRRAFDQAQDAMLRADFGEYRPVWMNAFYDQAELDSLALSAHLALADYPTAEAHAHRCLYALRPHMHRSKAITTTRLARAQLEQGDVEPAVATAMSVPADAATRHPRVTRMLTGFGTRLNHIAPDSTGASAWDQYARDTWRAPA
ncbi:helix-turn-helix transcriptional regulator [Streptomyces sp. NPDC002044]|uniref:helix-turn-helix domain-containing protein n=1 Tax=Streptomyces sp. NPDC002044 TaxID=3154662 RepID=UPI003316B23A